MSSITHARLPTSSGLFSISHFVLMQLPSIDVTKSRKTARPRMRMKTTTPTPFLTPTLHHQQSEQTDAGFREWRRHVARNEGKLAIFSSLGAVPMRRLMMQLPVTFTTTLPPPMIQNLLPNSANSCSGPM